MSKVNIDLKDSYLIYELAPVDEHAPGTVELSDDLIVWAERVTAEFNEVQDLLRRAVGDS